MNTEGVVPLRNRRAVSKVVRFENFVLPLGAAFGGLAMAYLITTGRWYLCIAVLAALPTFVMLHRRPLIAVNLWLLAGPLVAVTNSGAVRMGYWVVHRTLPLAALLAVMTGRILGLRTTRLPRCGLPELMMLGYVIVTLLSILYTSENTSATVFLLYDLVVAPMFVYLLLRLLQPGPKYFRSLAPILAFALISQTAIGIISWSAPGLLPAEWLSKLGERTTGSLRAPEVFGTVVLFAGVYLLHLGFSGARGALGQTASIALFSLALLMVFMSFSRSVWLAGLSVTLGLLLIYRRFIPRLLMVAVPIAAIVLGSGLLSSQLDYARERLDSEQSDESALSRLPVMLAAARMFEAKPINGWGYDNFDRYDRDFQGRVGNLINADKDHASHNLFLTTLAEQGIIGFVLWVGPSLIWLNRTAMAWKRLPRSGVVSRQFVASLWLALLGFFVVNNFYRFQYGFALGLWWVILGMIAANVDRYWRPEGAVELPDTPAHRPVSVATGAGS